MLKCEWVWKATGRYRTYSSLAKLQPWFLSFRWKTCLRQNCNLVPEFAEEDLPLDRPATLVPEFAVEDPPLV